jgi:hypothetical protein
MVPGPPYIASTQTAQRTSLPSALTLLHACMPRPLPNTGRCLKSHSPATAFVFLLISLSLSSNESICHNIFTCQGRDYRRGLDWWVEILATYTHLSELQVITAPPLISRILKSPQHSIGLISACCAFTSRSLATAMTVVIFLFLCARRYSPANIPQLNYQLNYITISSKPLLQNSSDCVTPALPYNAFARIE